MLLIRQEKDLLEIMDIRDTALKCIARITEDFSPFGERQHLAKKQRTPRLPSSVHTQTDPLVNGRDMYREQYIFHLALLDLFTVTTMGDVAMVPQVPIPEKPHFLD